MLISHQHKFIMISIPKTGSFSSRKLLHEYADIHSSVDPQSQYYMHKPASELKKHFDRQGWYWNEYFKFTFVRNPWSQRASYYLFFKKLCSIWVSRENPESLNEKELKLLEDLKQDPAAEKAWQDNLNYLKTIPTLTSYLKKTILNGHQDHLPQYNFFTDESGQIIVDFVGQLECYQDDMNYVMRRIGLPMQPVLHHNSNPDTILNTVNKHTEAYDSESIELVRELEQKVIEMFHYNVI